MESGQAHPEGSYSARGAGGHHVIIIIPDNKLVIVHRVNTDTGVRHEAGSANAGRLVQRILDARVK